MNGVNKTNSKYTYETEKSCESWDTINNNNNNNNNNNFICIAVYTKALYRFTIRKRK